MMQINAALAHQACFSCLLNDSKQPRQQNIFTLSVLKMAWFSSRHCSLCGAQLSSWLIPAPSVLCGSRTEEKKNSSSDFFLVPPTSMSSSICSAVHNSCISVSLCPGITELVLFCVFEAGWVKQKRAIWGRRITMNGKTTGPVMTVTEMKADRGNAGRCSWLAWRSMQLTR